MREIKFRAWNTSNGMKYMDSDFFIGADGTIYDRASRTHDTPNIEIESVSSMILMQFTGLHDKSGKEVYEGDIVRHNWDGDVMSHPGENIFAVEQDQGARYISFDCLAGKQSWMIEVIGNVYENPELLEVK